MFLHNFGTLIICSLHSLLAPWSTYPHGSPVRYHDVTFCHLGGNREMMAIPVVLLVAMVGQQHQDTASGAICSFCTMKQQQLEADWSLMVSRCCLEAFPCVPGDSCVPHCWHTQSSIGAAWGLTILQAASHNMFGFIFVSGDEEACLKWYHLHLQSAETQHIWPYAKFYTTFRSNSLQRQWFVGTHLKRKKLEYCFLICFIQMIMMVVHTFILTK